jgi:hypothetical protein
MTRPSINGIKLSNGPLIPMWIRPQSGCPEAIAVLCGVLGAMRVNIAFMTCADTQAGRTGLCCIDDEDHARVEAMILQHEQLMKAVHFGEQVGLLSFFPHQASLETAMTALKALAGSGIAIHGFASSIAAFTIVVDYGRLDQATTELAGVMDLPARPAAFRADFKVVQEDR